MTYLRFHLIFNLPVLLGLLWLTWRLGKLRARQAWRIGFLCAIVLVATAPWDNWAVHRGIWDFDWDRVTPVTIPLAGVNWRLPAEEYAFFLIETIIVSLTTLLWIRPGNKL